MELPASHLRCTLLRLGGAEAPERAPTLHARGAAAGWDALAVTRPGSGPHPVGLAGHPAAVQRRAGACWAEDSTSLGLSVLIPPSESYCEDETRRKRVKSLPSSSIPNLPASPHSSVYTWSAHLDPRSPSRPRPRLPSSTAPACPPHGSHQRAPVSARAGPHPIENDDPHPATLQSLFSSRFLSSPSNTARIWSLSVRDPSMGPTKALLPQPGPSTGPRTQ